MEKPTAMQAAKTNMEIAQTVAGGKMPTNSQLEAVLSSTAQVLQREGPALPPAGQKASHDAEVVIGDMQQFLREKNPDNNIQGIISDFAAMKPAATGPKSMKTPGAQKQTLSGTELRQQISPGMQDLMAHTKSLTKAVVRSHQLRLAFKELFETLRWGYFERSKATTEFIDQNWAPGALWTPGVPGAATTTTTTASSFPVPEMATGGELQREAPGIQQTLPTTYATQGPATTYIPPGPGPLPATAPITNVFNETDPARLDILRRLQSIKPMTEAQRIELRNRLFAVLIKFSQNEQFKNSLLNVFSMFLFYKDQGVGTFKSTTAKLKSKEVVGAAPVQPLGPKAEPKFGDMTIAVAGTKAGIPIAKTTTLTPEQQFQEVTRKLKKFVQSFVPGKSIDDFLFYTNEFFHLIKGNTSINSYLNDVGDFLKQTMNSNYQSLATIDQARIRQLDELLLRGDSLFLSFANHYVVYRMLCESIEILQAIQSDPLRKKLADDTRILVNNFLVYDAYGRASLNADVVSQMRVLLLPLIKEQLYYIPIPKIEGTSGKMDFWVDNLVFATGDILPDNLRFDLNHTTVMDRPSHSIPASVTRIYLTLENVKTNLKDVRFWYRKKTTPKMTDEGFANVTIGGRGVRIRLVILANFSSPQPFKTESVKVNCDKLRVKIHDSKHDFLYAFVLALFKGRIKREMELKAEASVRNAFDKMNAQLTRLVLANPQQPTTQPSAIGRATQPLVQALGNFANPPR